MFARSPYESNDREVLEQLQEELQAEIVELEQKLATAKERLIDLRDGRMQPRTKSRRLDKSLNLRTEALREVDSYIFTITYKISQAQERLQTVMRKLQYMHHD